MVIRTISQLAARSSTEEHQALTALSILVAKQAAAKKASRLLTCNRCLGIIQQHESHCATEHGVGNGLDILLVGDWHSIKQIHPGWCQYRLRPQAAPPGRRTTGPSATRVSIGWNDSTSSHTTPALPRQVPTSPAAQLQSDNMRGIWHHVIRRRYCKLV